MIYFDKNDEEDENKKRSVGKIMDLSGAPAPVAQAANGQQPVQGPTNSGLFTNLNKFLEANKGKAEQFAGSVAGNAAQVVNRGKDTLNQETKQFKEDVARATYTSDSLINEAVLNPDKLSQEQNDKLSSIISGAYNGPNAFTSKEANTQLDEGLKLAESLDTSAGKGVALNNYYADKKLDTRANETKFDNLLLNRDVAAANKFNAVKNSATDATTGLTAFRDNALKPLEQVIQDAKQTNVDLGNQYKDKLTTAYNDIEKKVLEEVDLKNKQSELEFNNTLQQYTTDNTEGDVVFSGVKVAPIKVDATQFIKKAAPVTALNVITADQQAKLTALAKLAGLDATKYAGDLTAPKPYSFDAEGYKKARAAAEEQYNQAVKAELDRIQKEAGNKAEQEWQAANNPPKKEPEIPILGVDPSRNSIDDITTKGANQTAKDIADIILPPPPPPIPTKLPTSVPDAQRQIADVALQPVKKLFKALPKKFRF